jgi:hypothetical protein
MVDSRGRELIKNIKWAFPVPALHYIVTKPGSGAFWKKRERPAVKTLNHLLTVWPYGAVVTQPWLDHKHVSRRQAAKYVESGWLVRVGHGAYARAGESPSWQGGVFGLQYGRTEETPRFWPGGYTALSLAGYAHYLPMGRERVELYGLPRQRLPKWFEEANWGADIDFHPCRLFRNGQAQAFEEYTPSGAGFQILVSSPERAVLEWLHVTPDDLIFGSEVVDTIAGLSNLRPRRLQRLLEACVSIRVKRVFLVLARHAGHAWYRRLETAAIELGTSKYSLVAGGRLDREYRITVPEAFASGL